MYNHNIFLKWINNNLMWNNNLMENNDMNRTDAIDSEEKANHFIQ